MIGPVFITVSTEPRERRCSDVLHRQADTVGVSLSAHWRRSSSASEHSRGSEWIHDSISGQNNHSRKENRGQGRRGHRPPMPRHSNLGHGRAVIGDNNS